MDVSILAKLAGLMIPIAGMAVPVILVFIVLQFRERQRQQLYDTVKHYADRGLPVPKDLLDPPRSPHGGSTPRFIAFTLIGIGVGLALMFWSLDLASLTGIGGLLVCVGIAQLIAIALDARDAKKNAPAAAAREP